MHCEYTAVIILLSLFSGIYVCLVPTSQSISYIFAWFPLPSLFHIFLPGAFPVYFRNEHHYDSYINLCIIKPRRLINGGTL